MAFCEQNVGSGGRGVMGIRVTFRRKWEEEKAVSGQKLGVCESGAGVSFASALEGALGNVSQSSRWTVCICAAPSLPLAKESR